MCEDSADNKKGMSWRHSQNNKQGRLRSVAGSGGWHVCDATANIHAARGVAIREFPLPGYGFADYPMALIFAKGRDAVEDPLDRKCS
jgi:hypothetical protein